MEFMGYNVEITTSLECWRGGDHRRLVLDARVDFVNQGVAPDDKFVLCGRCAKAISLKV